MLENLKDLVYEANLELPKNNLVNLTWGNVSQINDEHNLFVIKPSGVEYSKLGPQDMVVVDLDGNVVEGKMKPSSDTPTHAFLYKHWTHLGGIVHTHSKWAVAFCQAGLPIVAKGTTHADTFYGDIPLASGLTKSEVNTGYELNTGYSIVKTFDQNSINPVDIPAVLTQYHGPFTWGKDALDAVHNAVILEVVAEMAYHTLQLSNNSNTRVPQFLLDKHYYRKHGENAYYGQNS